MFTGYLLTDESRNKLLKIFPPKYSNVIAHHITEKYGVDKNHAAPPAPESCQVVGYINESGVEALLVAINGSVERKDGSKYHITWSLDKGKKPVETNKYVNFAEKISPINIDVIAKNFW